jgi:hypothetical protein
MVTKKKVSKKRVSAKTKKRAGSGIGFGIATIAAAAAAGTYFLYGSGNSAKNRKKIKGWTLKAKGEVLEKIEKMKNIEERDYKSIIDTVAKKYKKLKSVNTKEVESLAKELKAQWKEINKTANKKTIPAKRKKKK